MFQFVLLASNDKTYGLLKCKNKSFINYDFFFDKHVNRTFQSIKDNFK